MNRLHLVLYTLVATAAVASVAAHAQPTGTRVKDGASTQPLAVLQLDIESQFDSIRAALARGDVDEAERKARTLLIVDQQSSTRYAALNALCAVSNQRRDWSEAVARCGQAIDMRPRHWMAWNTRGTAYLMSGDTEAAAADYQRALELLPSGHRMGEAVRHNIELAERVKRGELTIGGGPDAGDRG